MENNPKIVIGVFIILLLITVGIIIWLSLTYKNLQECRNNESPSCPSFYCGNIISTGEPGTKCIYPDGKSTYLAYRYDKNGKLMCQNYTLPNNTITNVNYDEYKPPGPPTVKN